jgi:hypothetical protein
LRTPQAVLANDTASPLLLSGPFTVEAVQPQELSLDDGASPIGGAPERGEETFDLGEPETATLPLAGKENREADAKNADSYIENMIRLLRLDGVRFPDTKEMKFSRRFCISVRSYWLGEQTEPIVPFDRCHHSSIPGWLAIARLWHAARDQLYEFAAGSLALVVSGARVRPKTARFASHCLAGVGGLELGNVRLS